MSSHDHAPRRSDQPVWRHRGSIRFLAMACGFTFAMIAELQRAHSQHVLPVPGCPARGLTPPGEESQPYLERGFGCSPSGCDEISAAPEGEDSDASPLALPDWAHQYRGITGEYIYTGEVFSNVHGGINTNGATRYRGNLDLVMNVDTEGMDLWKGGRLFVYGSQFHGQTLTPRDVGHTQFYSNIPSNPRPENELQLTEFWYEHSFADGALIVKIGKQDANADFAFVDLGGDCINSSFGLIPMVPLPTWPNPGMGIAVFADLTDTWHLKSGISEGAPTGGQWSFSTVGEFGAMSPYQLSSTPQFGPDGDLPASFVLVHSITPEISTTSPLGSKPSREISVTMRASINRSGKSRAVMIRLRGWVLFSSMDGLLLTGMWWIDTSAAMPPAEDLFEDVMRT